LLTMPLARQADQVINAYEIPDAVSKDSVTAQTPSKITNAGSKGMR